MSDAFVAGLIAALALSVGAVGFYLGERVRRKLERAPVPRHTDPVSERRKQATPRERPSTHDVESLRQDVDDLDSEDF